MIPNNLLFYEYGKVFFSLVDVACSYLIYLTLVHLHANSKDINNLMGNEMVPKKATTSCFNNSSLLPSLVWLWSFNPLSIALSTRGSFDTLSNSLLLLVILHALKGKLFITGLWYGVFIHFRIYPVIYIFSLSMFILRSEHNSRAVNIMKCAKFLWGTFLSLYFLTLLSFYLYQYDYLDNAVLYHLHRVDFKHNFSLHFYYNYLFYDRAYVAATALDQTEAAAVAVSVSILVWRGWSQLLLGCLQTAVPLTLIATLSLRLASPPPRSLVFALFLSTLVFVAFNKVITAQVGTFLY
jgi:phosphatidylinositol glycan class M